MSWHRVYKLSKIYPKSMASGHKVTPSNEILHTTSGYHRKTIVVCSEETWKLDEIG